MVVIHLTDGKTSHTLGAGHREVSKTTLAGFDSSTVCMVCYTEGMKICSRCSQEKPLDEFYSDRRVKGGKQARCKLCTRAAASQSQKDNWGRYRDICSCGATKMVTSTVCQSCRGASTVENRTWHVDRHGYVVTQFKGRAYAQHRYVMEQRLGRPLRDDESVHHKNGQRDDNRLDNLELWSRWQPTGQRVEDKIQYACDILRTYAPRLLREDGGS